MYVSTAAFFTREFFVAIDPITSLHMGICNCDDTYNKATRLADEISKQHAAFAENPETLDEWKAVNYMSSPRNESRKHVFEEHHHQHISPRESPKVSSRKSADAVSSVRVTPTAEGVVEEVSTSPAAAAGMIAEGREGRVEAEWSDDEENGGTSRRHMMTSVQENEVADFSYDASPEGFSRKSAGISFKGEHDLLEVDEDTQSTSMTSLPHVHGVIHTHSLPSLQTIFLGNRPLIMSHFAGGESSTMTQMDAKKVYGILRKESCRDTHHLLSLLKWRLGDLKRLRASDGSDFELNEKMLSILVGMGIPVFLAMEVADFLKQYL